jgi:ABC-type multidrug transport system ATPase subunit
VKISCSDLSVGYGNVTVIKGLSTEFPDKSVNVMIGPSGSGKSTFIRALAALEDPIAGTIYYGDKAHNELHPRSIRSEIGTIFQRPVMFEGTVYDNLVYGLKQQKLQIDCDHIKRILKQMGIPESYLKKKGEDLSVGEQQRICIIRALLPDPKVFFMDEPTSALDPQRANRVLEVVKALNTEFNKNVIMVSHDVHSSLSIADRVYFLSDGKIRFSGSKEEFEEYRHPDNANNDMKRFLAGEYE